MFIANWSFSNSLFFFRSAAEACVTPRQSSDANENVCDTADDTCKSKEDVTVEDEEAQGECVIS